MSTIRCFVAIELSEETRRRAVELASRLASRNDRVKWVAGEQMHLTLNFLGDIDLTEAARFCQAAARAAATIEPFGVFFAGAGAFPHLARPRAIWLGVENPEPLEELHDRLSQQLASVGWTPEHRRFHPHVTLGRLRGAPSPDLGERIQQFQEFDGGVTDVDEVVVFSSRLERQGPEYEVLGRAPLGGAARAS